MNYSPRFATCLAILLLGFCCLNNSHAQVFTNQLAVPPQLFPKNDTVNITVDVYNTREFFPGFTTETFGMNGMDMLGPTLRLHRDSNVVINVKNNLTSMTTMHWHGFHLPGAMDGGPHQPIVPNGGVWSPTWTIGDLASTLWYHPHLHHKTTEHVVKGIAGFAIIDDANSDTLSIPKEYGIDDFPLALQTKRIDSSSHQFVTNIDSAGVNENFSLVNGVNKPYVEVPPQLVRFRMLDGAATRAYLLKAFKGASPAWQGDSLVIGDSIPFHQIATDGGLLENPVALNRVIDNSWRTSRTRFRFF